MPRFSFRQIMARTVQLAAEKWYCQCNEEAILRNPGFTLLQTNITQEQYPLQWKEIHQVFFPWDEYKYIWLLYTVKKTISQKFSFYLGLHNKSKAVLFDLTCNIPKELESVSFYTVWKGFNSLFLSWRGDYQKVQRAIRIEQCWREKRACCCYNHCPGDNARL